MAPSYSKCCRESYNGRSFKKNETMVCLPAKVPRPERDSDERLCGGQVIHRPFRHSATEFVQRLEWMLFQSTEGRLSRNTTMQLVRLLMAGATKESMFELLTKNHMFPVLVNELMEWIYYKDPASQSFQLVDHLSVCDCAHKTCCSRLHRGDCGSCRPRGPHRFGPVVCDYSCGRFTPRSRYFNTYYNYELEKLAVVMQKSHATDSDAAVAAFPSSACTTERRQG